MAGDLENALRYAVPLLEREPNGALESFVVGQVAVGLGEGSLAKAALDAAARAAISESNFALGIAAAHVLAATDESAAQALLARVASAFGRGSPLLGERRAAPPGLPGPAQTFAALSEDIGRKELVERATRAVEAADKALSQPAPRSLSPQPLFSSLAADDLAAFAAIFEVRLFGTSTRLVEEGSLGSEAFVIARGELDVEKAREDGAPVHLARLGIGALVGEMALLLRSSRAATVIAVRPSVVLVAEKQALDRVAEHSPIVAEKFAEHCKRRMLDNLVRTSPLFRAATPAERPALVERFGIRTFEPGQKLARQGAPSEGLYLLGSGDVTIVHHEGDERTLVTRLGAGDVVGEVALVLRRPAIADAVAHSPTVSLFLPRERFLDLVRAHPKVFADLYEIAIKRDEEIETMSQEEAADSEAFVLV